jgi:hypothetical protein
VKYTGTGSNASFGHGLSSLPELVIVKRTSATEDWFVLYDTTNTPPNYMKLNTTSAGGTSSGVFPSPATSTVVNVGNDTSTNSSGSTYIAYCFHSVTGYQKIGSYTGTGALGNVINVGFKPRFLLWKKTNGAVGWFILDGIRNTSDVWSLRVEANVSNAESGPDSYTVTVSDTGFEMTGSFASWTGSNELNSTYIYLAIK